MTKGDLILSLFLALTALVGFISNLCIHIQIGGRLIDMGMYLTFFAMWSVILYATIQEYKKRKNKLK